MTDQQFKRNIALKHRIGDLLLAKPIMEGERFTHLELGEERIVRVNVIGNIVDRYDAEGEKKYVFLTLDDGSGQIKLKVFGDDSDKFKFIQQGQTVVVIGTMRNYNNETYINPEIIRGQDPKYLLIRKTELEKTRSANTPTITEKSEVKAVRDQILDKIKAAEEDGGIDVEKLITEFQDVSPEVINEEVQKLLEEGVAFEPRPGKVRYLG